MLSFFTTSVESDNLSFPFSPSEDAFDSREKLINRRWVLVNAMTLTERFVDKQIEVSKNV